MALDAEAEAEAEADCAREDDDEDDDSSALTRRRLLTSPPAPKEEVADDEDEDDVMKPHAGPAAMSASRSARDVNAISDTSAIALENPREETKTRIVE